MVVGNTRSFSREESKIILAEENKITPNRPGGEQSGPETQEKPPVNAEKAEAHEKPPVNAEKAEAHEKPLVSAEKAEAPEKPPVDTDITQEKPPVDADKKAEAAEALYFSSLEKDDTLVKKPKTLPLIERPDVERIVRWGSVFLGASAQLALRIKDRQEPIHIEVKERFVIGRVHPRSAEKPDLDLNRYGAFFHGVSRQHVAIIKDGNLLQIEDLGSTNGTYLNGVRLVPHQPRMLRDGDELCLGHLVMRIHYLNLASDPLS
jgi:hypothetical protein